MPSSKGTPTDPELREQLKEGKSHLADGKAVSVWIPLRYTGLLTQLKLFPEVKQETNKDGSGKGQWAAWKVVIKSKSPMQLN